MSEPIFKYTPIDEIPAKVHYLRDSYDAGRLQSLESRRDQLRKLYFAIKDHEDDLKRAIKLDLNKAEEEFEIQELNVVKGDILETINSLEKWAKPCKPADVKGIFNFASPKIIKNPLGVVLVIGAFNFPLNLTLQPLIAAVGAGNTVLLKQSELVPNFASTLTNILTKALDPDVVQIVDGGVEETTAVLEENFDKIIYTGSGTVGKIVAKKASETLTPVVLELGGKSPVFVTENCNNLRLAAKRIAYAKNSNAGQICISTDFILCHESKYDEFVENMIAETDRMYGETNKGKNYGHIVHDGAFKRLESVLNRTNGDIVYQNGEADATIRFLPSTIVKDVTFEDSLMEGEIFGPILPIIKYTDLDDAITDVQHFCDTPLALYIFSNSKAEEKHIIANIRSGAVLVNDALLHAIVSSLPFGGVGQSGYGNYHGVHGFNTFSHDRAYLKQPAWTEALLEASFPPISAFDLKMTKFFLLPAENINRTGPVIKPNYLFHGLVAVAALIGGYFGYNGIPDNLQVVKT